MSTKTEYTLITSMDEKEFIGKVNWYLEEGYSLQGGVASRGAYLLQAVTREKKAPASNTNNNKKGT